jgi:hypothetical protein
VIFLLVQIAGCKKQMIEPMTQPGELVPPVRDTADSILSPVFPPDTIQSPVFPSDTIFENLTWIFPWYNAVEISKFTDKIPSGASFKVFIQRDHSPEWKNVPLLSDNSNPSIEYEYFVEKRPDGAGIYNFGSLYIFYYRNDVSDSPSVKIEY